MSSRYKTGNGFTLPEFIVAITIVTVILAVLLSGQSKYNDKLVLRSLADDVSLRIFQAQAYGSGVREFSTGLGEFSASYGLTFSILGSGSNTAYLNFADRDGDDIYDGDWTSCGTGECLERVNILHGVFIEAVCMIISPTTDDCGPPGSPRRVDISFNRPNTEAQLKFFNSSGGEISNPNMVGAKIVFRSPSTTATSSVIIYTTGQVSVR